MYHWQEAVNWINVAAGSAHMPNPVAKATDQIGTAAGPGGEGRTLGNGYAVGWRDMDFDNGALSFRARVVADGDSRLELRSSSVDGPLIATYMLPDTHGQWADIERTSPPQALLGRHDAYLVQVGGAPALLPTVEWTPGQPIYAARAAVDRLATVSGHVEATRGDELKITGSGTISLPTVEFKSGAQVLALTNRSTHGARVSIYSDSLDSTPIATGELPATPQGDLRSVNVPLDPLPTRAHMLFVRVDGDASLRTLQADPVNSNPPSVDVSAPAQVAAGTPVRIPVTAVDRDGHAVTVRSGAMPAGASVECRTGDIVWLPTDAEVDAQPADDRRTHGDRGPSVAPSGEPAHTAIAFPRTRPRRERASSREQGPRARDHARRWSGRTVRGDQIGATFVGVGALPSPARAAAFCTSPATAGTTRMSKIEGTILSGDTPSAATMSAIARDAATFIDMSTDRARLSSNPRNMPGNTRTLLIWLA